MINGSMGLMPAGKHPVSPLNAAQLGWNTAPQFLSRSLDETMRHMERVGRKSELDVCQQYAFEGYRESILLLHQVALSLTTIKAPGGYALGFRPRDEFCLNIPLCGEGWIESGSQIKEIKPRQAILFAPSCAVRKHWLSPSEVLTIHIPTALMLESANQSSCAQITSMAVIDFAEMMPLFDLIRIICGSATDPASAILHPSVACHLEKALLALLFRMLPTAQNRSNPVLASPAVPYYVRRAEDHMRINFRTNLALSDLAEAASVSPRTLQYGFKHFHGMTPMLFLKRLRLNHARAQLLEMHRTKQVGEVALDVGYQNASHFASDYRATFGEPPSQTVTHRPALN